LENTPLGGVFFYFLKKPLMLCIHCLMLLGMNSNQLSAPLATGTLPCVPVWARTIPQG